MNLRNKLNKARSKIDRRLLSRLLRRYKLNRSYKKGSDKLPYAPEYLQLDVISHCNLKCRMCPQGTENGMPEKGIMGFDLYKKIIDSGRESGVFGVFLVLTGEPLMHKKLIDMIRYAKSKKLKVQISTNCTLLTPRMSEELIKSGLDEILLSFDTVKKELYEDYRRGAKYEKTLNNIIGFLETRKRMKSATPFPIMHNLQKFNPGKPRPEVEKDFESVFGKYGIWIIPKYFSNWSGIMEKDRELYRESGIDSKSEYVVCPTVYQRIVVSWDGKAVSCCNDFRRQQIMGDASGQSIAEIWNGPAFVSLRRKLADKEYEKFPLCKSCGTIWR